VVPQGYERTDEARQQDARIVAATRSTDRVAALLMFDVIEIT